MRDTDSGDTGLSRRRLLAYGGGGLLTLGVGGVLAQETILGPDCSGPKGTVRCFFRALNDGNTDRAKEFTHSERVSEFDSTVLGNFEWLTEYAEQVAGGDADVDGGAGVSSTVEELTLESDGEAESGTDGTATVVADMSYEIPIAGQDGSYTVTVDLRREDGEWQVWALEYEFGALPGMDE